nr:MAG TPA: hypothetical protein [Caudoviricetes sp.]
MAGYQGYSMSNNAVSAYDDGEKPISKWSESDVISAIADELGVNESDIKLKYPYRYYLKKTSWHHTSSKYNKTDFYSVSFDDEDIILTDTAEMNRIDNEIKAVSNDIDTYKSEYEKYRSFEPSVIKTDDDFIYVSTFDDRVPYTRYSKQYVSEEEAVEKEEEKLNKRLRWYEERIERMNRYIEKLKQQKESIMGKNRLHEKIVRINNTDIDTTGVNNSTTTHLYDESENNRKNFEKATSIEDRDDIDKDILKDKRDDTELPKSEDSKKMFLSESLFEESLSDKDEERLYANKYLNRALERAMEDIRDYHLEDIADEHGLDIKNIQDVIEKSFTIYNALDSARRLMRESATRLRKPSPLFDDLFDEVYVRLINTPSDDVLKKSEHRHLLGKYSDAEEIVIDFEDGYSIIKVVTPIADDKLGYAREIAKEYEPYGVDTEYSKDDKFETLKFIITEGDSPYDEKRMTEYEKKKTDKK